MYAKLYYSVKVEIPTAPFHQSQVKYPLLVERQFLNAELQAPAIIKQVFVILAIDDGNENLSV